MRAVLISIQPKWCELIASGKKTVEVRKTKPNLATPFKCYIYQSRKTWLYNIYSRIADWQGKVIGEFVCDKIDYWQNHYKTDVMHIADMSSLSCVSIDDLLDYLGHYVDMNGVDKKLYAWHISDLVIYDKPKELSEFTKPIPEIPCLLDCGMVECVKCHNKAELIKRPPQSWCYVEVI